MGMNKVWLPLLFFGIFACAAAGEENKLDKALLARLTGVGCESLARLEGYFKGLDIEWTRTRDDRPAPYRGHYYPGRRGYKIEAKSDQADAITELYLYNRDYFSHIYKKPDDTAWKLDDCIPLDEFDPYAYGVPDDYYTLLPFAIHRQPLARIIKNQEMKITGLRLLNNSPEEAVVLDFVFKRKYIPNVSVSGTLTLLPKKSWAIAGADLLCGSDGHFSRNIYSFQYGDKEEFPYFDYKGMTITVLDGDDPSAPPRVTTTYEIKKIGHQSAANKELRLPFYGLREPDHPWTLDQSRRLLAVVGSALILLLIVLRIRRERRSGAMPQEATEENIG